MNKHHEKVMSEFDRLILHPSNDTGVYKERIKSFLLSALQRQEERLRLDEVEIAHIILSNTGLDTKESDELAQAIIKLQEKN